VSTTAEANAESGQDTSGGLPSEWARAHLEEVVDILDSRRVPVNAKERAQREGAIPYYGATGQVGTIDAYLFDEELVLLGEDGAPFLDASKQTAYVIRGKSWVNNHAHVLRSLGGIPNAYVKHYLDIVDYRPFVTGTTRLKLNQAAMRQIPIPLASPGEQKRIVAEIEKQFSRLDEAVANLKRVQANLKRYKAAVLKAAVEGKLTEEWRKQHPDVEPAGEVLKRVRARDGIVWEAVEGPHALPAAWVWTDLDHLLKGVQSGKSFKCEERPPLPGEKGIVKVSAVTWGTFNETESKTIADDSRWVPGCQIIEGDFLFSRANTIELVGACVLVGPVTRTLMLSDKILRFDFAHPVKEWVLLVLRSMHGRKEIESLATGNQESMRNIAQRNIRRIRVPFLPSEEQKAILAEVAANLSVADQAQRLVVSNLKRAERLRQSILQKAFSGQLVPQDPADEPASTLLERIRAERAATERAKATRTKPAPNRARKPRRPAPRPASSTALETRPTNNHSVAATILGFMKPGLEYFRSDVVGALGLTVGQWNAGIRELKESGAVVQRGERRGARYSLAG
jgi:type I restriction enzyme S subunit